MSTPSINTITITRGIIMSTPSIYTLLEGYYNLSSLAWSMYIKGVDIITL